MSFYNYEEVVIYYNRKTQQQYKGMIHEEQKNTVLAGRCFSDKLEFFQVTGKKTWFFAKQVSEQFIICHILISQEHFQNSKPRFQVTNQSLRSLHCYVKVLLVTCLGTTLTILFTSVSYRQKICHTQYRALPDFLHQNWKLFSNSTNTFY